MVILLPFTSFRVSGPVPIDILEKAAEVAALLTNSSGFQAQLDTAAKLALHRGDWASAEAYSNRAADLIGEINDHQFTESVVAVRAELHIEKGEPQEALTLLESLEHAQELLTSTAPILAWAHLEAGEQAKALELAADVVSRSKYEPLHLIEALRIQAKALSC